MKVGGRVRHEKEWRTCDRCGKEIKIGLLCTELITRNGTLNITYDLCNECMEDFKRFMRNNVYAIPIYRYKNNKLCSAFEEAKENEEFVRRADFNAAEERTKKRMKELSEKLTEDRQSYYECLYKREPIEPNNKKCNITFCRYNADGKCTNDEKRKECIEVPEKALCIK